MKSLIYSLLFVFFVFVIKVSGQDMFGLTTGNYSGINGVILNPAGMINSKLYLDVNFAGFDFSLENSAVYIRNKDFTKKNLFHNEMQVNDENAAPDRYTLYDNYDRKEKSVFQNLRILGTGAMLNYKRNAFGFSTSFRNVVSVRNLPFHVTKFAYDGLDYSPQHGIRYQGADFMVSQMAWTELNFSYARKLINRQEYFFTFGITVKRLMGYSALFMNVQEIDYMQENDSILDVYDMNAQLGLSLPMNYTDNEFDNGDKLYRGYGWGMDIGFVYQKNDVDLLNRGIYREPSICGQKHQDYLYRVGVSLLDVGGINFTRNALFYDYQNVSTYWPGIDEVKWDGITEALGDINYHMHGDSNYRPEADYFKLYLPTALSVQLDYHIQENFYLHTVLINPVKLITPTIWRPAELAVVPRYESRLWDVFLPLSLYDYSKFRVGLAARFACLTIGSEKIGSLIGLGDFTGTDIYASIKFNFNKGYCKNSTRKFVRKGKGCNSGEFKRFLEMW